MKVFNNPYSGAPLVWSAQQASIMFAAEEDDRSLTAAGMRAGISTNAVDNQAHILGTLEGVTIQFQRQFTTRYPIGGGKPIKMGGIPRGTITLNSILGPTTSIELFLLLFGSSCKSFALVVNMFSKGMQDEDCGDTSTSQLFVCGGCTGSSLSYQIQTSQDGMSLAQGTFNILFTDLEIQN